MTASSVVCRKAGNGAVSCHSDDNPSVGSAASSPCTGEPMRGAGIRGVRGEVRAAEMRSPHAPAVKPTSSLPCVKGGGAAKPRRRDWRRRKLRTAQKRLVTSSVSVSSAVLRCSSSFRVNPLRWALRGVTGGRCRAALRSPGNQTQLQNQKENMLWQVKRKQKRRSP